MDGIPLGAIEIGLAFGAILLFAAWELRRNRRALNEMRKPPPVKPPPVRQETPDRSP